jgi:uncharacterized protein
MHPTCTTVRRARFLRMLRATHRWIGLWGAVLGLLFGLTGFLLNHRAVLKIPATESDERMLQIPLPAPPPASPEAMAAWLKDALNFDRPAARVRREPQKPVAWGDRSVVQPERWQINFVTPQRAAQAEYWVGNASVNVRRTDSKLLATLTNFHKGTGAGVAWVLLVDTLAGSILLLSLTGVILWTQLSRKRLFGAALIATVLGTSLIVGFGAL